MNLRRVLLVADESANWMVAGLRQLDRLALSIDEFATENNETAPVLVCIFWKATLDESQRWTPRSSRLTHVAFTAVLDGKPYDLILSTRLFLYRKAVRQVLEAAPQVVAANEWSWEFYARAAESLPRTRSGAWEYVSDGAEVDAIERTFLRGSGKSQDGLVSRFLNRPISRAISRLLLRFPTTPTAWTWLIFPIPVIASLMLAQGRYGSVVWGLVLFQVFSVLDGCDGEIARAKFMESERGRQLDDLFDVLSNILLALGLAFGLGHGHHRFGALYLAEGIATAVLIIMNEWLLARGTPSAIEAQQDLLGGALYPRHRALIERSGILRFGEKFASLLIQLTKRDVAVLFFLFLALVGAPALILHLLFVVTVASLALALRARLL
jgi:phosphatidylglycerophosphate synthase